MTAQHSGRRSVLILNAGRRVELIGAFREATTRLGLDWRVTASDIQNLAPALYAADSCGFLPRSRDLGFAEALAALVARERVALIVPTIDPDLEPLAALKPQLKARGAYALVSPVEAIRNCRDKVRTAAVLSTHGLPAIPTLEPGDPRRAVFPLYVKPRSGSSSIDAAPANTAEELDYLLKRVADPLVQPFIPGEEFTVDVFRTEGGRVLAAAPRLRLKVLAGEVSVGRIQRDPELERLAADAAHAVGLVGTGNVQIRRGEQGAFVLEINPRFGGGAPLAIRAGMPLADWSLMLAQGEDPEPGELCIEDGLTMLRYGSSLFLHKDELLA